jgi:manganese/zinc/iron transport system permease protein
MLIGTERGVMIRFLRQSQLKKRMGRQHLLRALYEILEGGRVTEELNIRTVPFRQIRGRRTWSDKQLRNYIRRAYNEGLVEAPNKVDSILLTKTGLAEAAHATRNHRLWEMYLIEYADVATSRVDRDADMVEHVLGEKMVARLENKLQVYRIAGSLVPQSPHPIHPGD